MTDDNIPAFTIRIKFSSRSGELSKAWLDENTKGWWAIGKETECYEIHFEYAEDALKTWWKWG